MSQLRLSYPKLSADAYAGLIKCKTALEGNALELSLLELVYLRMSQINGCAFCLDLNQSQIHL